jgi:cyclopropane fatty-acyl-phospholipid synthase-like methyltransferase
MTWESPLLRCPRSGEPLRAEGNALVSSTTRYPLRHVEGSAYADFRLELDAVARLQRETYEQEDSRYVREGLEDKRAFMAGFVEDRVRGRVKAKEEFLLRALRRLPLDAGSRVLEVGCNDGRYLNTVAALSGCEGVGIDLSERSIAQAVAARPVHLRTRFHVAQANALPFAEASFDVLLSFDVFEHLGHPGFIATMRECHRVLRPGGVLLVYVVSQKDTFTLHETIRRVSHGKLGVDDGEGHQYENFIHPDFFRSVARESGLEVKDVTAYHGYWTLLAEECLHNVAPRALYRLFSFLDAPLVRQEHGNGFLALSERPARAEVRR